eukprot:gene26231-17329_t
MTAVTLSDIKESVLLGLMPQQLQIKWDHLLDVLRSIAWCVEGTADRVALLVVQRMGVVATAIFKICTNLVQACPGEDELLMMAGHFQPGSSAGSEATDETIPMSDVDYEVVSTSRVTNESEPTQVDPTTSSSIHSTSDPAQAPASTGTTTTVCVCIESPSGSEVFRADVEFGLEHEAESIEDLFLRVSSNLDLRAGEVKAVGLDQ